MSLEPYSPEYGRSWGDERDDHIGDPPRPPRCNCSPAMPGEHADDCPKDKNYELRRSMIQPKPKVNLNVKVSIPVQRNWRDSGPRHEECETENDYSVTATEHVICLEGDGQKLTLSMADLQAAVDFLRPKPPAQVFRGTMLT